MNRAFFILSILMLSLASTLAREVEVHLRVTEKSWAPAGKIMRALMVNDGIPGPTLRFREGDRALIRVTNGLTKEEASIHWHGLLLPNVMDGVPYVTTPPIAPGESYLFDFTLRQSGTYWYHSHTGLQEQRGVYGAIVIEPKDGEPVAAARDHVVLLSDWTNENPSEVMRTLMRGSDWYSIKKGNAQSVLGAIEAGELGAYFSREKARMAPMDLSDVAYDAFLINGRRTSRLATKPGERVRLRLINAGASTYFYTQFAGGPLTIVAADGQNVKPVPVERLLMGMAETYDVVVQMPPSGSWEFRATAQDGSGYSSLWLGEGEDHEVTPPPMPNLYSMDHMLTAALEDMDGAASAKEMPSERPGAPYNGLRATCSTKVTGTGTRSITLRLTGDMKRYTWSFNGKTFAEDSTIPVNRGEVLRLDLVNDTMMHHPIHLHGHFFRLLNGQGDYSPLKHTVDVPPMGKRSIEFLADEEGDWLFHCHLLYHMDAGMTRVFSYRASSDSTYKPELGPMGNPVSAFMLEGMWLNHMTMGMGTVMSGRNNYTVLWDYGLGDHAHHNGEIDALWSRYLDPNWSVFGGYRFTDDHDAEDRAIAGVSYRLPYLIDTKWTVDSEGDLRVDMSKSINVTSRLSLFLDGRYDTSSQWEYQAGASYLLNKQFSLTTAYHSDHGFGGGVSFRF